MKLMNHAQRSCSRYTLSSSAGEPAPPPWPETAPLVTAQDLCCCAMWEGRNESEEPTQMAQPVPREEQGDLSEDETNCCEQAKRFIGSPRCCCENSCWEIKTRFKKPHVRRSSFSFPNMLKIYFSTFCCMVLSDCIKLLTPFIISLISFPMPMLTQCCSRFYPSWYSFYYHILTRLP